MFSNLNSQISQIVIGNFILVACCIFYILWWTLAFNPIKTINGFTSGWLLIPAFICGIIAIVLIYKNSFNLDTANQLYPNIAIIIGGIIIYIALLVITSIALHRQITTELFLIIGWLVTMFIEINALFSTGILPKTTSIILLAITVVIAIVSLICYLLYYNLDVFHGFIDGMIPLVIIGCMMIATNIVTLSLSSS